VSGPDEPTCSGTRSGGRRACALAGTSEDDLTRSTGRKFRAGVPYDALLNSWTLLDTHDTARFGHVTGSRDRHLVGLGVQFTSPGVPMVFAGDEIGLGGAWGEDARRTMPWDRRESWDTTLLGAVAQLARIRVRAMRSHAAASGTSMSRPTPSRICARRRRSTCSVSLPAQRTSRLRRRSTSSRRCTAETPTAASSRRTARFPRLAHSRLTPARAANTHAGRLRL
jgi:hypothetical protein